MATVHVMHLRSNFGGWGGVEPLLLSLAGRATPTRFRVSVVSFRDPAFPRNLLVEEALRRRIKVKLLPWNRWNPYPWTFFLLQRLLRREGVGLVHVHDPMTTLLGWATVKTGGPPVVATVHGWIRQPARVRVLEAVARRALRHLPAVLVPTDALRQELIRDGVSAGRLHVVRYALEPRELDWFRLRQSTRREYMLGSDDPVIGMFGRLSQEKGIWVFLRAIQAVIAEIPRARVFLVGAGPLESAVRAEVRRANLDGHVIVTGFVEEVPPFLACVDVVVLASLTEGLPILLLEAMSAAKPIVASSVGGVPEVVVEGQNGYLVPPGDPAALAKAIALLIQDPERARAMGRNGQEVFQGRFCIERMVRETEQIYLRVLAADGDAGTTIPPRQSTGEVRSSSRSFRIFQ
jgi:glycosyltransferase involved in cell wall biosynthesis